MICKGNVQRDKKVIVPGENVCALTWWFTM